MDEQNLREELARCLVDMRTARKATELAFQIQKDAIYPDGAYVLQKALQNESECVRRYRHALILHNNWIREQLKL